MAVQLYNTLHRKKEEFNPLTPGVVRLYTCGPTVYNYAHIGNLRTYVFEDILKRVLLYNELEVEHVMNITDVGHLTDDADSGEEKMEVASKREGKSAWELAEFYTEAFQNDIERLNILDPNIWCKATDHIQEQIDLVKALEDKGFTYIIPEDGVYFDSSKFKDYGKMALLDIEGLKAGARVKMTEGKRNPTDFSLWKFSPKDKQRQMEWDSPWGKGFPGWHIECSAMSMKYLGDEFDIHCGGIDHISVHHTNEIAQVEAVTEKPWVQVWMHGEFLVLDKAKMAKSGENFITLQTVIDKGYDPLDYRYFILGAHYRSKLNFSWEAMDTARNGWNSLKETVIELKRNDNSNETENTYKEEFLAAINDDLNTPQAMSIVWGVARDKELGSKEKLELMKDFDHVLGLGIADVLAAQSEPLEDELQDLLDQRKEARDNKDFEKSDELRDLLKEKGVIVEDRPNGQVWKRA
jgi:cysteinyl-tRNA synthetase